MRKNKEDSQLDYFIILPNDILYNIETKCKIMLNQLFKTDISSCASREHYA